MSTTGYTHLDSATGKILQAERDNTGLLLAANNLSDITAVTARTNLGLGTLATQSGTFSGTASGTNTGDQDLSGLMVKANNLSDLTNAATALSSLGIQNIFVKKTTVDLKSGVSTLLYQPASGSALPLIIAPLLNTATALVSAGIGSIGLNGGTEFVAATTMPSIAGKGLSLIAPAVLTSLYTNAAPLYYNPTAAAVATTLTADFYVFGILI